jgi:hypothetical protein
VIRRPGLYERRAHAGAIIRALLGLAACSWVAAPAARAETRSELDGLVQVGIVQDSNVLERLHDEAADQAMQVFGTVEHRLDLSARWRLTSVGRIGFYRYLEQKDDSRVMGNATVGLGFTAPSRVALGAQFAVEGRDYADSAATRGYGRVDLDGFLHVPVGSFVAELGAGYRRLDFRVTPGLEQDGYYVEYGLNRRFARYLLVRARAGGGTFHFSHRAVIVEDGVPIARAHNQRDEYRRVGFDAEYLRGFYVGLGYTLLDNDSNSFGNSYRYHRVEASFGDRLSESLSVRLLLKAETRRYDDDLSGFDVINFDSEREDNNAVVGEVGQSLLPGLTLKFRIGWHRNESILRDRQYDKWLAETHLAWQL